MKYTFNLSVFYFFNKSIVTRTVESGASVVSRHLVEAARAMGVITEAPSACSIKPPMNFTRSDLEVRFYINCKKKMQKIMSISEYHII